MQNVISVTTVYICGAKWVKDGAMLEVIDNSTIHVLKRRCHWLRCPCGCNGKGVRPTKSVERSRILAGVQVLTAEGIEIKVDPTIPSFTLGSLLLKDGFTITLPLATSNNRIGKAFGGDLLETVTERLGWRVTRIGLNTVEVNRKVVDVRTARARPYNRNGGLAFQFWLPKWVDKYENPDFVVLVCLDGDTPHWFMLPFMMVLGLARITITIPSRGVYNGKWSDWLNRWDVLQPEGVAEA